MEPELFRRIVFARYGIDALSASVIPTTRNSIIIPYIEKPISFIWEAEPYPESPTFHQFRIDLERFVMPSLFDGVVYMGYDRKHNVLAVRK
jgi:hypothetical protein